MRYFTLLWDPEKDAGYAEVFVDFEATGSAVESFSCGNRKDIAIRDRVILRQVGRGVRGIVGVGTVEAPTFQKPWSDDASHFGNFIRVRWDALDRTPYISAGDPKWLHITQLWGAMAGGQLINEAFGEAIYSAIVSADSHDPPTTSALAEAKLLFREGSLLRQQRTIRDRNRSIREHCLDHYNSVCAVCRLNSNELGELSRGLMDVHHLDPMAQFDGSRETDPVQDCRPLCPICHRLAHLGMPVGKCRSLDDIRGLRVKMEFV